MNIKCIAAFGMELEMANLSLQPTFARFTIELENLIGLLYNGGNGDGGGSTTDRQTGDASEYNIQLSKIPINFVFTMT